MGAYSLTMSGLADSGKLVPTCIAPLAGAQRAAPAAIG